MNSKNRIKLLQKLEKNAEPAAILKKISKENDINMAAMDPDAFAEDFFQKVLAVLVEELE